MTVLGPEHYQWHHYTGTRVHTLTIGTAISAKLRRNEKFGLRPSVWHKGKTDLVLQTVGFIKVFTPTATQLKQILADSKPCPQPAQKPQKLLPAAAKLAEKFKTLKPSADYWEVIAAIAWPQNGKRKGYTEAVQHALAAVYKPAQIEILRDRIFKNHLRLRDKLEAFEEKQQKQLFLGGDDSLTDAVSHAVSMGKEAYDSFLKSPEVFIKTFNRKNSFTSFFEACFDEPLGAIVPSLKQSKTPAKKVQALKVKAPKKKAR